MKIAGKIIYTSLATMCCFLFLNIVNAQEFTEKEKTIIINRTDSLIQLYNNYGTFVEDVGYFSNNIANKFVDLFTENTYLFNDIDLKTVRQTQGIFTFDYIKEAKQNFPSGLFKAEFEETSSSEVKISSDNKFYFFKLTGTKTMLARNNFKREYNDYQLIIVFDTDLQNFKIRNTGLDNLKISKPEKKEFLDAKILVFGPDNQPYKNAKVVLSFDKELYATEYTNDRGLVEFKQFPRKTSVNITARSVSDPTLELDTTLNFNSFVQSGQVKLVLEKFKSRDIQVTVRDSKTTKGIRDVTVSYQENYMGEWKSEKTNGKGIATIVSKSIDGSIRYKLEKEGYKEYISTENYTVKDKEVILRLSLNPHPQFISLLITPAFLIPMVNESENVYDLDVKSNPSFAFGAQYEVYPFGEKNLQLGLFGILSLCNLKFSVSANSVDKQYNDIDIDGEVTKLRVNSSNIVEEYNLFSVSVGGGIAANKKINDKINVTVYIGPFVSFLPGNSTNYTIDSIEFSGIYDQYFNTELKELPRYGYTVVSGNDSELNMEASSLKSLGFGFYVDLAAKWNISEKFGLSLGLNYSAILTNLLSSERYSQIASINNKSESIPGHSYYGLLNQQDSFRLSKIGLQIGFVYRFK